jgi:hypothetical protein
VDYEGVFESFKRDIVNSFTLVHPDFSLEWFLFVDASDLAGGGDRLRIPEILQDG